MSKQCAPQPRCRLLYNNPLRTGFNLEIDTLIRIVQQYPQVVALKEAGNPDTVNRIKTELGADFQVLSGLDLTIVDYFEKGYDGLTSVAGNLFPLEINSIVQLLRNGRKTEAEQELMKLRPSLELLGEIGWIRVIRHFFSRQGLIAGNYREPLTPLTAEEQISVNGIQILSNHH